MKNSNKNKNKNKNKAIFIGLLLLMQIASIHAEVLQNNLLDHPSPYLAMHGSDLTAWQEWTPYTVKRAQKEGKLLFVSSGYFSCHWCHVMQRESYQNNKVAGILNKHFIPVKVDRELDGALDSKLIDFVERTQGQAGWPLNVFITPEGFPLVGMTYVPTENFITILNNLKDKWQQDKKTLVNIAKQATEELNETSELAEGKLQPGLGYQYMGQVYSQAVMMMDEMSGGFGEQNKFPSVPQLNTLLQFYKKNQIEDLKRFLVLTLDRMASQGLRDHLAGGFYRYAVDPTWQIPHFEKMLYDNALLANLYFDAATIFNNKEFENIASDTLNFLFNVFKTGEGAYIASLSAIDDKGVEGGYYIWQKSDLKKLLTKEEYQVAELVWQIQDAPDIEYGQHLIISVPVADAASLLKIDKKAVTSLLQSAKRKLLIERNKRTLPVDNKIIASWNGLALSAFAKGARVSNDSYDREKFKSAAKKLKDYIYKNLWNKNQLYRSIKNNQVLAQGELEDYAYVARGLGDWLMVMNSDQDREWLGKITEQAWKRFYGKNGWQLAENMLLKYGQGQHLVYDGVLPSTSAVMLEITLQYSEKYKNKAIKALNAGHQDLNAQPFWNASHINVMHQFQK